ncbi:hypothetical protein D3C76_1720570 [compost metagenome]
MQLPFALTLLLQFVGQMGDGAQRLFKAFAKLRAFVCITDLLAVEVLAFFGYSILRLLNQTVS